MVVYVLYQEDFEGFEIVDVVSDQAKAQDWVAESDAWMNCYYTSFELSL